MNVITQAIGFALLSLLFAGCLDVLFKRYSMKQRSRGVFLAITGVVWGLLQLITVFSTRQIISFDQVTLSFGLAAGLLVTLSNLMLVECLTHLHVSLGSTIYRLNTIGVVFLSFLFLGESLELFKLLGIACGIVAALLLYHHQSEGKQSHHLKLFFGLIVLASILRAGFSVVTKAGLSLGASGPTMLLMAATCWVVGGFAYALLKETPVKFTRKKITYAALSGLLVYLTVNTLFAALARGDASVVVPIANLSFIMALAISVMLGMERLTIRTGIALAFASASIFLLAQL
jgi:uncharacterized membrane protein